MSETLLIGVASIIVLGIGAQWLAWRFRIPSILLLLVLGFLAGPVTGFLDPDALLGDLLLPLVSLSVGIILFEGGLSLRISEWRDVGKIVRNLITIGVLVTWVMASLAAYWLFGIPLSIAIVIGSILVVTGPTVIIPLLRHVRPTGRVGAMAKWEGITIDPVGAILAVLALEAIILIQEPGSGGTALSDVIFHTISGLFLEFFIGLGVAVTGAVLLVIILRRHLIPEYLQNSVALMIVVAVFAVANSLQHEAGLLATTVMGIVMANQRFADVSRITEFKEDLGVLLIGMLFILLSARMSLSDWAFLDWSAILFLLVLMVIVRPVAVWFSSLGTSINRQEWTFLSWLAPRGIVAAAVASISSFRLQEYFPDQVGLIVPVTFLVIIGTVAIYGLSIAPLARWLGLAQPNPQGLLILGAQPWMLHIAKALQEQGIKVLLLDTNPAKIAKAVQEQIPAYQANVLSETVADNLELGGMGRFLAMTPNDEVNALATLNFSDVFGRAEIFQVTPQRASVDDRLPQRLRGRYLFGPDVHYATLEERFDDGAEVRTFELTAKQTVADLQRNYGPTFLPLFLLPAPGQITIVTDTADVTAAPAGQKLIALVDGAYLPKS